VEAVAAFMLVLFGVAFGVIATARWILCR
jgi:hypothetical protein